MLPPPTLLANNDVDESPRSYLPEVEENHLVHQPGARSLSSCVDIMKNWDEEKYVRTKQDYHVEQQSKAHLLAGHEGRSSNDQESDGLQELHPFDQSSPGGGGGFVGSELAVDNLPEVEAASTSSKVEPRADIEEIIVLARKIYSSLAEEKESEDFGGAVVKKPSSSNGRWFSEQEDKMDLPRMKNISRDADVQDLLPTPQAVQSHALLRLVERKALAVQKAGLDRWRLRDTAKQVLDAQRDRLEKFFIAQQGKNNNSFIRLDRAKFAVKVVSPTTSSCENENEIVKTCLISGLFLRHTFFCWRSLAAEHRRMRRQFAIVGVVTALDKLVRKAVWRTGWKELARPVNDQTSSCPSRSFVPAFSPATTAASPSDAELQSYQHQQQSFSSARMSNSSRPSSMPSAAGPVRGQHGLVDLRLHDQNFRGNDPLLSSQRGHLRGNTSGRASSSGAPSPNRSGGRPPPLVYNSSSSSSLTPNRSGRSRLPSLSARSNARDSSVDNFSESNFSRAESGWTGVSAQEWEDRYTQLQTELELSKAELLLQQKIFDEEKKEILKKSKNGGGSLYGPPGAGAAAGGLSSSTTFGLSSFGQREAERIRKETVVLQKFQWGRGVLSRKLNSAKCMSRIFLLLEPTVKKSSKGGSSSKQQDLAFSWSERTRFMTKTTKKVSLDKSSARGLSHTYRSSWKFLPDSNPALAFVLVGKDRDLELIAPTFSQFLNWFLGLQYLIFIRTKDGLSTLTWNFQDSEDISNQLIWNATRRAPLLLTRRQLVFRYVRRKLLLQARGDRERLRYWLLVAVQEAAATLLGVYLK
ncbi:unnamed protein product [Amoebophrya sp. A120]|nr:unnamed protein product [Amoebophrya sp. A120]|eukprot:GSA120T00017862001.1